MKSILQKNTCECLICGTTRWLEWHHVFGAATRTKSGEDGLVVRLCHHHHNEPPNGVHHNKVFRRKLQAFAQKKAMEHYGWTVEDFIREYHRSYLEEDV